MKLTYGEMPYPPCAGRQLTQGCVLLIEGPCHDPRSPRYVASAWCGRVCIGWRGGATLALAREFLLQDLHLRYFIEEVTK